MTGSTVFVVVKGSGIDSIYASGASATKRADALKADATDPSSIRVELHQVKDDEEKPSVKPAAKATAAKKTKDAGAQRAANAEKPTVAADADLPENMKSLLGGSGDVLSGKSRTQFRPFVVTGVPPTLQRKNAEKLVLNYGGKLVKSISKNTSFVVLGNEAGPKKLEQIAELAIETLDEDAFIALLDAGVRGAKRSTDGNENPVKVKKQKK